MKIKIVILISVLLLSCSAAQAAGNTLSIEGPGGWTKHLEVAPGSTATLVVLTPKEGNGVLYDQLPDGSVHECAHYFLCRDSLPFHANAPGRHVLHYVLNGKASNTVAIDVKGTPAPKECSTPSLRPGPCAVPQESIRATSVCVVPRIPPISLSRGIASYPMILDYRPVGAHIMNHRNGVVIPKYGSQYHFGKDFSLGTIDNNYPGTPFVLQYLSDP